MSKKLAAFALLALSFSLSAFSQDPPKYSKYDLDHIGDRGIGSGLNTYSVEREYRLGRSMAADIERQVRLQHDPLVNDYVKTLVNRLVRHSDAKVAFTVKVIDSDEINAFALPGGFLYVDTGLIIASEDEAQLAGVLSHEIAHVAARHMTRAKSRRFLIDSVTFPLWFVGPGAYGAGFIGPLSSLKFGRDAEREADLLGLQYMYSAGYDPAEFVSFFESLADSQTKVWNPRVLRFLAAEPGNEQRLSNITQIVSTLPQRDDYIITSQDFDVAKARLLELGNYERLRNDDGSIQPRLRRPTMHKPKPAPPPKPQTFSKLPPIHMALLASE